MTPSNPYRTSLVAFAAAAILAGLVLAFTPLSEIAGPLVGLGLVALLLWLTVSSIAWSDQPAAAPSVQTQSARTPAPKGSLLEQIRQELDD